MSGIGPGDLVVCVDASLNPHYHRGAHVMPLQAGRLYRVASLYEAEPGWRDSGQYGLVLAALEAFPAHIERFRKLNDEPDDAELIAKIRACKPVKVSA